MPRPQADTRFQAYRVRNGVESPFSDEQQGEICSALTACDAQDKYLDTITYLEMQASHFMPWGNLDQYPAPMNRRKGLNDVADMASNLAQAIWGDQSIVGADAEQVHLLMLNMKRLSLADLHKELVGLAAVCRCIADTPTSKTKPLSSMEQLAHRLAGYFLHALKQKPTSSFSEAHGQASPYMRILMVCATAFSGRHKTWAQLKKPALDAVRSTKQVDQS